MNKEVCKLGPSLELDVSRSLYKNAHHNGFLIMMAAIFIVAFSRLTYNDIYSKPWIKVVTGSFGSWKSFIVLCLASYFRGGQHSFCGISILKSWVVMHAYAHVGFVPFPQKLILYSQDSCTTTHPIQDSQQKSPCLQSFWTALYAAAACTCCWNSPRTCSAWSCTQTWTQHLYTCTHRGGGREGEGRGNREHKIMW